MLTRQFDFWITSEMKKLTTLLQILSENDVKMT